MKKTPSSGDEDLDGKSKTTAYPPPDDFGVDLLAGDDATADPSVMVPVVAVNLPETSVPGQLIRNIFRDPFLYRLPFAVLNRSSCMGYSDQQSYNRVWLQGRAQQLADKKLRSFYNAESYLNGKLAFMRVIWPTGLLIALCHDLWQYDNLPQLNYGNTLKDIFLGISPNIGAWATHMGSDLAATWDYWSAFIPMVTVPVLMGLANIAMNRNFKKPLAVPAHNNDIQAYYRAMGNAVGQDYSDDESSVEIQPLGSANAHTNDALIERDPIFARYKSNEDEYVTQPDQQFSAELRNFQRLESLLSYRIYLNSPFHWLNPLSANRRNLNQAVCAILYNKSSEMIIVFDSSGKPCAKTNYTDATWEHKQLRVYLLNLIIGLSRTEGLFAKHFAIMALAEIVDKLRGISSIPDDRTALLAADPLNPDPNKAVLQEIFRLSLSTLQSRAHQANFAGLIAKYQLWNIGYSQTGLNQSERRREFLLKILFFTYAGTKYTWWLYCWVRYWEFIIVKTKGGVEYLIDRANCHAKFRDWTYDPFIGNYDCKVCDWPFAFDQDSAQGCIDGLLDYTDDTQTIITGIEKVTRHGEPLQRVNMADIAWPLWSDAEFSNFITAFQNTSSIAKFDGSSSVYSPYFNQQSNKISTLTTLVTNKCVKEIDLSNRRIGDALQPLFTSLFNNSCLENIIVPGNALTDQWFRLLVDTLAVQPRETLDARHNSLSYDSLQYLANHSSVRLKQLTLGNDDIGQLGLNAIGQFIANNPSLETINLSQMSFSLYNMTLFGQSIAKSNVVSFTCNGCNLGGKELVALAPYVKNVAKLDLSNNEELDAIHARSFMTSLQGGKTQELKLRGVPINGNALLEIRNGLNQTNIQIVDISRTETEANFFVSFVTGLTESKVHTVRASDNHLGDAAAQGIIPALSSGQLQLEELDLSDNNLSDLASSQLITSLLEQRLKILKLNNNALQSASAQAAATLIAKNTLQELHVAHNHFSTNDIQTMNAKIPGSALEVYDLSNNQVAILGDTHLPLAKQLLQNIPDPTQITGDPMNPDLSRWVNQFSTPGTKLRFLGSVNNNVSPTTARAFCNVMKAAGLVPENVTLENQPANLAVSPCYFLPQSRKQNRLRQAAPILAPSSSFSSIQSSSPAGLLSGASNSGTNQASNLNTTLALGSALPVVGLIFMMAFIAALIYKYATRTSTTDNGLKK